MEYLVVKAILTADSKVRDVAIADSSAKEWNGKTLQELLTHLGHDRWSLSFAQSIAGGSTLYIFQREG